jgi:hypothetical protein
VPHADFQKIAIKAATEKPWFEALLKNPESALREAGMSLSPEDLKRLKAGLKGPAEVKVNFVKLLETIHSKRSDLAECLRCCIAW